jgi:hypothetical protein
MPRQEANESGESPPKNLDGLIDAIHLGDCIAGMEKFRMKASI